MFAYLMRIPAEDFPPFLSSLLHLRSGIQVMLLLLVFLVCVTKLNAAALGNTPLRCCDYHTKADLNLFFAKVVWGQPYWQPFCWTCVFTDLFTLLDQNIMADVDLNVSLALETYFKNFYLQEVM